MLEARQGAAPQPLEGRAGPPESGSKGTSNGHPLWGSPWRRVLRRGVGIQNEVAHALFCAYPAHFWPRGRDSLKGRETEEEYRASATLPGANRRSGGADAFGKDGLGIWLNTKS